MNPEPQYKEKVVVFLDILGFKSIVDSTEKQDVKDYDVKKIYHYLQKITEILTNYDLPHNVGKQITQFSDSIVISFEYDLDLFYHILLDIQDLVIESIESKILLRGGVTYGKVIHNNQILFGPAVVDAYLHENKSIFPRIILSNTLIDLISERINEFYNIKLLKIDLDNTTYINCFDIEVFNPIDFYNYTAHKDHYIDSFVQNCYSLLTNGLQSNNENIKEKYYWFLNKFEKFIALYRFINKERLQEYNKEWDEWLRKERIRDNNNRFLALCENHPNFENRENITNALKKMFENYDIVCEKYSIEINYPLFSRFGAPPMLNDIENMIFFEIDFEKMKSLNSNYYQWLKKISSR